MPVQLFTIARKTPGKLSTMARPRGNEWLSDEIAELRSQGVTTVVSLLTPDEVEVLGLHEEGPLAEDAGITFLAFPIGDRRTTNAEGLKATIVEAESDLRNGGHVAVHCRLGIGRSSMFAAAILVREGLSPDEAWWVISDARGLSVPDTEEQRRWLDAFVEKK